MNLENESEFDMQLPVHFPPRFLFGAATAAHQVEGNNRNNDWWAWEYSENRVAQLKKRGLNPSEYQSGVACDHYNRFREDFDLAKEFGHTAHRFGIEWARIEPQEGVWDRNELAHYRAVLEALRGRNIMPFITLHHYTLPQWAAALGGWENERIVEWFTRYARFVVSELGDLCSFWLTFNEPQFMLSSAYLAGRRPPKKFLNISGFLRAYRNVIAAHKATYRAIHEITAGIPLHVSIAFDINAIEPMHQWSPLDAFLCRMFAFFNSGLYLGATKNALDFIGVNYYAHVKIGVSLFPPRLWRGVGEKRTDTGAPTSAEGLLLVLRELNEEKLPIYITENGLADAADRIRPHFLIEHLIATHEAVKEGIDVRGYFHWSLMDNFEWNYGFWPRFGLFEIDYATLKRIPRKSAYLYRDIIRQGGITQDLVDAYSPPDVATLPLKNGT